MTITYRTRQDAGGGGGSHRLSITKERWKTGEERNDYRTTKFAGNIEQIRDICMCSAITIRDRKDRNTEAIADREFVVARTADAMAPIIQDYRLYA